MIHTRKTPFDGKQANIVGDHPHSGCIATCMRAELAGKQWGLVFKNNSTDEEFFVFDPKEVIWEK